MLSSINEFITLLLLYVCCFHMNIIVFQNYITLINYYLVIESTF